jgi:hypothetical protein
MGTFIDNTDLQPFADIESPKAAAMIADVEATAVEIAPCLPGLTQAQAGETADETAVRLNKLATVKAILRAAILRWNEAGSGALQSSTVGPFGQTIDTRVARRDVFWPTEIERLERICTSGTPGGVFTLDTAPDPLSSTGVLMFQPGVETLDGIPWWD